MACYHPLRAFDTGALTKNFKTKFRICGSETFAVQRDLKNSIYSKNTSFITEWTPIPCGQCIGCRLNYSRTWADRCMLEAQQYEHNAFITLTYDPEHLPPLKECLNTETGEIFNWPSLDYSHLKKFLDALRDYYEYHYNWKYEEHEVSPGEDYDRYDKKQDKFFKVDNPGIRYYACGEYGGKSGRPHFHILVFNMPPLPDMKHWFTTDQHEKIYHSDILQNKIWKKGICSIGELTWNSAAYVARYVVKKQKGKTKGLIDLCGDLVLGLEKEDTRMSLKPGIAKKYYDENKHKFYETDEIVIAIRGKVRTIKPPRYFDKMYDLENEDPFIMREIKEARAENAKKSMQDQLSRTTLSEQEYLAVKERNKLAQVERLKRGLVE